MMRRILKWAGIGVVLLLGVWALASARSAAHDFYSIECCSGLDCDRLPPGSVSWTPQGWHVRPPDGWRPPLWGSGLLTPSIDETVPFDDERLHMSPAGERGFHLCVTMGRPDKARCLYQPQPDG